MTRGDASTSAGAPWAIFFPSANTTIVVEIEARLLGPHGTVVASLDAKQTAPASANSVPSVVAAFDQAVSATLAQIVTWTLSASKPPSS